MLLSFLNILFLIAFLSSAALQYNDPDALIWSGMYLAAASMCINHICTRQPWWLPSLLLVISLVWIGLLLPHIIGQVTAAEVFKSLSMQTQEVEEAREIGGLLIVAIWAVVLMRYRNSSSSPSDRKQ
jgi:hypothetical protein